MHWTAAENHAANCAAAELAKTLGAELCGFSELAVTGFIEGLPGKHNRRSAIQALYREPNTSRKHPARTMFAYELRGLAIERPTRPGW